MVLWAKVRLMDVGIETQRFKMIAKKDIKTIEKLYCVAILLILAVIYVLKFYTAVFYPFPQEYREMTMIKFAVEFAKGVNPYAVSALSSEVPSVTSVYGVLPAILCTPFVFVFGKIGVSALVVCRTLTLLMEVGCLVLTYKTLNVLTSKKYISISGVMLMCACFWRYRAFGGAFPDQWGMFANFLLMYLIVSDEARLGNICIEPMDGSDAATKKSGMNVDGRRATLYALILVLAFYIKQYFVFSVVGILVYTFIRSKKDFIKLVISGAVLTVISLLIVQIVFPLYLSEALPISQGSTESYGFGWSIGQVAYIVRHYYLVPVAFVVLGAAALVALKAIRTKTGDGAKETTVATGTTLKTVAQNVFSSYSVIQIICIFPFVLLIARNSGTYITYWFQLWFIYVVIAIMQLMNHIVDTFETERIGTKACTIVMLMTLLFTYQCRSILLEKPHSSECIANWQEAYSVLDELGSDGKILADAQFSAYLMERDIQTSEYGQCEYSGIESLNNVKASALWSKFPYAIKILEKNIAHEERVREQLKNHEYSCVAFTSIYHYGISDEELENYGYKMVKEIDLEAGNLTLDTRFFVPEK